MKSEHPTPCRYEFSNQDFLWRLIDANTRIFGYCHDEKGADSVIRAVNAEGAHDRIMRRLRFIYLRLQECETFGNQLTINFSKYWMDSVKQEILASEQALEFNRKKHQ